MPKLTPFLLLLLITAPVSSQARLDRLSDTEFWSVVSDASEPGGAFHADNFTSNEPYFANTAATLAKSGPHGGAYLGVLVLERGLEHCHDPTATPSDRH